MGLSDIESTLPPGFRFYPSDEELFFYYLYMKVINGSVSEGTLVEVDLHTTEPWELPVATKFNEKEHYFFAFRDRKYSTGFRTNRGTKSGYWKATGKDRIVHDPSKPALIGMRKTLVFYGGRAPNGSKSGWVMHEYRLENPHVPPAEGWVLCRVFHKTKGEAMRHDGQDNVQDNIVGSSSFSVASSIPPHWVDQGSTDGHEQQPATNAHGYREGNPWSPYGTLNRAEWPYGLLAQEVDNTPDLRDGGEEYRLFLNMEGP